MNQSKSKEDLLIEYILKGNIGNFAKLLLKHPNINVNHVDEKHGDTALILASSVDLSECVELLLKHPNINVNHANLYGHTALMYAIRNVKTKCV